MLCTVISHNTNYNSYFGEDNNMAIECVKHWTF